MIKKIEVFLKRRTSTTVLSLAARAEKEEAKRVPRDISNGARVHLADLFAARVRELEKLDQQTRAPLG